MTADTIMRVESVVVQQHTLIMTSETNTGASCDSSQQSQHSDNVVDSVMLKALIKQSIMECNKLTIARACTFT